MNMMEWITTSCILLALICAIRQIFKEKLPAKVRYGIWFIVLVRLLLPVSLTGSSVSVLNLFSDGLKALQTQDSGQMISSPDPAEDDTKIQDSQAGAFGSQILGENVFSPDGITPDQPEKGLSNTLDSIWKKVLAGIWITGMAVCGMVLLGSNLIFMGKLRRSRHLLPSKELMASGYGRPVTGSLPVYVSKLVNTPCLFGLFHPAIYIRPEDRYNATDLPYILKHEYTHYRHLDHVWAFFRSLCLMLHWYNPLVWAGAYWNRQDGELACDASVLADMEDRDRIAYGKLLIDLTSKSSPYGDMLCCATTMSGGKKNLIERVRRIAARPRLFFIPTTIAVFLCAAVSWVTFTAAREAEPQTEGNLGDFESAEKLVNVIFADVTHDGVDDAIFTTVKFFTEEESLLPVDELLQSYSTSTMVRVYDGTSFFNRYSDDRETWEQFALAGELTSNLEFPPDREAIWESELGNPHVGNGMVFLTRQNEEVYLLEGSFWVGQGMGEFSYRVFSPNAPDSRQEADSRQLSFSMVNFSGEKWEDIFSIPEMLDYTEQIAPWLENGTAIAVMRVGYEPLVARPGQNMTIQPWEIWTALFEEPPAGIDDLEEKLEQILQELIAEDSADDSTDNVSEQAQEWKDGSISLGDVTIALYESEQDIISKLDGAGLSYSVTTNTSRFHPLQENAYDSYYEIDNALRICFKDGLCVRLSSLNEVPQTARGIHEEDSYSQLVEQYGDSHEKHTYAAHGVYDVYRYSFGDFICEFAILEDRPDAIYNIDIYISSLYPIYDYGEELIN